MVKKIVALILVLVTGGAWAYLDYQNRLEIQAAEELRIEMQKAREQAAARARAAAEARARFEAELQTLLTTCQADAEKAKSDFLEANKKPVKRKPGQFTVSKEVEAAAAAKLEADNTACKAAYDARLAQGS